MLPVFYALYKLGRLSAPSLLHNVEIGIKYHMISLTMLNETYIQTYTQIKIIKQ